MGVAHFESAGTDEWMASANGVSYPVRSSDGTGTSGDLRAPHEEMWRRRRREVLFVLRSVAGEGVRSVDVSREPPGRGGALECPRAAPLPDGLSRAGRSKHTGRCERTPGLAYFRGLGPVFDQLNPQVAHCGAVGTPPRAKRLCAGRPLPSSYAPACFLGSLPTSREHDGAHAARLVRLDSGACGSERSGRSQHHPARHDTDRAGSSM